MLLGLHLGECPFCLFAFVLSINRLNTDIPILDPALAKKQLPFFSETSNIASYHLSNIECFTKIEPIQIFIINICTTCIQQIFESVKI